MSDKKTGGPAFPRRLTQVENSHQFDEAELKAQSGMTLRDYFAAKAMHGILAAFDDDTTTMAVQVARKCYEIADAMIVARKEAK